MHGLTFQCSPKSSNTNSLLHLCPSLESELCLAREFLSILSRSLTLVSTKPFLQYTAFPSALSHEVPLFLYPKMGSRGPGYLLGISITCLEEPGKLPGHRCRPSHYLQFPNCNPPHYSPPPPRPCPSFLFFLCCGNCRGILNSGSCKLFTTD